MREPSEMMKEHIWVPMEFKGDTIKVPFLLFVGWTMEERRWYEQALTKLREFREVQDAHSGLCFLARSAADFQILTKEEATAIRSFFATAIGGTTILPRAVLPEIMAYPSELYWPTAKEIRSLWLDTQINMVAVPKYDF